MISGVILGGLLTILSTLILILAGILGWIIKRNLQNKEDIDRVSDSYEGTESRAGHLQETRVEFERINSRLDDMEDLVCSIERRRTEEHEEVKGILAEIIDVLEDEGFDDRLPEVSDD